MNFIGHAYLSGPSEKVLLINFTADLLPLNYKKKLEGAYAKGLLIHQKIDAFTDNHPYVKGIRSQLFDAYSHYSRVIVDILLDHFLITHWDQLHELSFTEFIEQLKYKLLKQEAILPEEAQKVLHLLIRRDWMGRYGSISGIKESVFEFSHRTPGSLVIRDSYVEFIAYYEEWSEGYMAFMEDMKAFLIMSYEL